MPKYKATAYIRLSYTDDHSSESDSVSNQRKLIENFVEHNPDIEVVSEKIDDGYSGIIFDRPAFKEMMQDVTDGNINCVIVKDLSRLGREYIETGRYLRRVFPAYGVRFIAITDSIDTAHDSGDDLTVSVKNIMNEAYCRDISIKTRTSLDVKRRNGDFVGAFPVYGYMKAEDNKNLLVPDPYAARVVCDIFRMRLEGASASKIASELNRLGIDQSSINQALAKEYSDHITDNERRLEQVLEFKARLYESLVGGMLTKEEYASYKAKYTKQAEDIRESVRVLKEKLTEVLENRSERNRWISQFTQFSTLETLDRRALIHMVQSIRVRGKKELDITFTHEDEYKKALQLLALAAQQKDYKQRKVG